MQPAKGLGNSKSESPKGSAEEAAPGNVDKIRDILFGSQMKDYETRFNRLEETLLSQTSDLRESTRKRLDALENYLRKELESLQSRLKAEEKNAWKRPSN